MKRFSNEYFYWNDGLDIFARTRSGYSFVIDTQDEYLLDKYCFCNSKDGYFLTTVRKGASKLLHRLIMQYDGPLPVDHINGHKWDNRKKNLRICTHGANRANSKTNFNSKTGIKGVVFIPKMQLKPWYAQIKYNGEQVSIGYFATKEEASMAFNEYHAKIWGTL